MCVRRQRKATVASELRHLARAPRKVPRQRTPREIAPPSAAAADNDADDGADALLPLVLLLPAALERKQPQQRPRGGGGGGGGTMRCAKIGCGRSTSLSPCSVLHCWARRTESMVILTAWALSRNAGRRCGAPSSSAAAVQLWCRPARTNVCVKSLRNFYLCATIDNTSIAILQSSTTSVSVVEWIWIEC